MIDRTLFKDIQVSDEDVEAAFQEAFDGTSGQEVMERELSGKDAAGLDFNTIMTAKVIKVGNNEAVLDIGLKSEGLVGLDEWDDSSEVKPGDEVQVLVEDFEVESGMIIVLKTPRRPHPQLAAHRRDHRRGRHRQGSRPPQDQGWPARRHRRAGLPARFTG